MHEGRTKDPKRYLREVFLPWAAIRLRVKDQVRRIVEDIGRTKEIEACSVEDAVHIATKIYRPLVADIFDPYVTLLVATYQVIDGTFTSIVEANVGSGERNKAELIEARIKRFGGLVGLLSGHDPIVRNALSHAGSEGVRYEDGVAIFRNIKRGTPPTIEARRWTHEQLHLHVIALIELVMSIDAACDLFGIDCLDMLTEGDMFNQALFHAMTKSERMVVRRDTEETFRKVREAEGLTREQRIDALTKMLFLQCAEREIPCSGARFDYRQKAVVVDVPVTSAAASDDEITDRVMYVTRYAVLARAVFGTLFDKFLVEAKMDGTSAMTIELPAHALDEYLAEVAGLVDLIADAHVWIDGGRVRLVIDELALEAIEDASLGPRFPRRGRPVSN